jgi:putative endonuclease
VCEVKARRSTSFGAPLEAVGPAKQERLRRAAEVLVARDTSIETVRFDVIAVDGLRLRHLPGVF